MDTTWATRVRELEALGWTLTGLGEAIGLSAQGVSDIKQGRTKAPTGMAAVVLHRLHAGLVTPAANDDGAEEQGGQVGDAAPSAAQHAPAPALGGVA